MLGSFYQAMRKEFRAGGLSSPDLDARLLICHACDMTYEQFVLKPDEKLSPDQISQLENFKARRLAGEPVSRIVGKKEFWGRDFLLGDQTLDPRPDTETLIDGLLYHTDLGQKKALRILDLGTGTGAILLTLLKEWSQASGVGCDLSPEALDVASQNAALLGCGKRAQWVESRWFDNIEGQFDLIVSNPPYIVSSDIEDLAIEVCGYDPILALDGGETGLVAYQEIISEASDYLKPGGMIAFEFGKGQFADVLKLILAQKAYYKEPHIQKFQDLAGLDRCIFAKSRQ